VSYGIQTINAEMAETVTSSHLTWSFGMECAKFTMKQVTCIMMHTSTANCNC